MNKCVTHSGAMSRSMRCTIMARIHMYCFSAEKPQNLPPKMASMRMGVSHCPVERRYELGGVRGSVREFEGEGLEGKRVSERAHAKEVGRQREISFERFEIETTRAMTVDCQSFSLSLSLPPNNNPIPYANPTLSCFLVPPAP